MSNVVFEVLRNGRPAKPGESGEVVATGLNSYEMPFIRYRLGDIVTKGHDTCGCGQPFSTILDIRGRMHDYFKMPDGRLIHPDRIIVPVMENESGWFDQYQLLQKEEDYVVLKVRPSYQPSDDQLGKVVQLAKEQLPPDVTFEIEFVDKLAFEANGKFRFCKSMVNSQPDEIDWSCLT